MLTGSVRSGKTFPGILGFMHWLYHFSSGNYAIVSARTQKQLDAVVWYNIHGWMNKYRMKPRRKDGVLIVPSAGEQPNYIVQAIGDDKNAVSKILGITAKGAYVDEVVEMPKDFVDEIGFRCSLPGAKIVTTCNPEGPAHWFKTDYVDRADEINGEVVEFELTDNPTLSEEYIAQVHKQYAGVIHARKVMGQWAAATGAIYPTVSSAFLLANELKEPFVSYYVFVDVASSSSTHALLCGRTSGGVHVVVDEWVHDATISEPMRVSVQVKNVVKWTANRKIAGWYVDPSAHAWIIELQTALSDVERIGMTGKVMGANNDVLDGIQTVTRWLEQGWLKIVSENCPILSKQMSNYEWDERAANRGEDKPVKENDHGPDAVRYGLHSIATQGSSQLVRFG